MDWVHGRHLRLPGLILLTFVIVMTMLGSRAMAGATADGPKTTPGLLSLDVVDADLSQVVRILMSESKQNIVIGDPDAKRRKVTAMLNNVSLETALRHVVESAGCTWRHEPDGVYVITPKSNDSSSPSVPEPISAIVAPTIVSAPDIRRRGSRVDTIQLYNSSPSEMLWTLGVYQLEDLTKSLPAQPKTGGVYTQKADGTLTPLFPEQTPPMTQSLKSGLGVAQRAPDITAEALQVTAPPGPTGYPRPPNYQYQPRPPGQPGNPNQQTSGLLPEGIDFIMSYDLDNSLIVRGNDEGIEELKTIISKLDIPPKQIMIEARFVSISTSELQSLGINWSLQRLNSTFATQFSPAGNILVGYANGNLMANLATELNKSHGKLINAPIVTTMNNQPASIGFQTQVPILSSTTVFNQAGGSSSASQTYFLPITSALFVQPRVNYGDNSITVQISPQISDISSFVDTTNGTMPIVDTQFVQTSRRVANGETIVLGGLIRKDDLTTVDKIPFIGDLPIIGPLFRNTKTTIDDKELLIFLTPTIVPERQIGGTGVGVTP